MASGDDDNSYWNATAAPTRFPQLAGEVHVDVAIIGGGIVGITTARLLKDMGKTVAVVEARRVGREVTGKSTAKMTSQHAIIYQTLERKFGEDRARLYAEAQEAAIREMSRLAAAHGVSADIEEMPAFCYTRDEKHVAEIEKEVEVARRLGLPATLVRGDIGLPYEVLAAVRFDGQAQFHPTRYVAGLAETLPGNGSHVFENSRAVDWEPTRVVTDTGTVTAGVVVMATHLPLGQVGGYYAMAYPKAEPVIVAPIRHVPPGMYINAEQPSHSIRAHRAPDGTTYAIAAGQSFKPGHTDEERQNFADLEHWLENFDAGPAAYRWVNEDYTPMDSAPFIGWSSSAKDGYLVATGFDAWGISNGTAAAMILADLATGKDGHAWLDIFDATRVKPMAGGGEFVKENLSVAAHLVGGYLASKPKSFEALAPGQAAVMKIDGDNVAAFKDETGTVHAVSAVCTHMGCLVGWNETDRTWDCPCHGSRFELSGRVIHGPATRPLGSKITG
ncbi:FAD-dependent oxidoreductase [Sphingosinicella sp. BN140058]|uniref:FAD-dependent oxidoreductase n=1 Tax=Sphingosinicella sp. BN140058 TaxID=1892855 RepID=UPI0010139F69|nr:FAD-dependent oxidoreductase [Sphingosinicella sp. BN140058]QAY77732.1 FAD-dependent oxidoreductase [Sphingosinicella sp. BN140058]